MMARLLVGVSLPWIVRSHFVWQTNDVNTTALTFSENGQASDASLLFRLVENKTQMNATGCTYPPPGPQTLTLQEHTANDGTGKLVAQIPSWLGAPYALETFVPFGIFSEGGPTALLQYYTTAPMVTEPNDWFVVQDVLRNRLEITIRDPYMNGVRGTIGLPGGLGEDQDECTSGESSEGGDACVVAVVRFDGELISSPANVTTFDATGAEIATAECDNGVLILKVPMGRKAAPRKVFARVNVKEMTPGSLDGKDYQFIDHWATTSADIARP